MRVGVVTIGGIPVRFRWGNDSGGLEESYRPFLSDSRAPQADFSIHHNLPPRSLGSGFPVLPAASRWRIFRRHGKTVFILNSSLRRGRNWKIASLRPGLAKGDIWLNRRAGRYNHHPLFFLDQLLFSHLLCRRRGTILHAAAFRSGADAYLFPGPAGSGKSTWSSLVGRFSRWEVLGEDKVAVRWRAGAYRVFGTPWNPRQEYISPAAGRLKGVYFLEHASRNRIVEMSRSAAFHRLLQCVFLPFEEGEQVDMILSLLQGIIERIPCYRFGFRPDSRAARYFLEKEKC